MKTMLIELKKYKRSGLMFLLISMGLFGALYGFVYFYLKKESLINNIDPTTILFSQSYGLTMAINMFAIIASTCLIYNIEYKDNAIKKMIVLPINFEKCHLIKFIILSSIFMSIIFLQKFILAGICTLTTNSMRLNLANMFIFSLYSFITSLPVLSFMLLCASKFENIWTNLGIGIAGFFSAMATAMTSSNYLLINPFLVMIKPAVSQSLIPNATIVVISIFSTLFFLLAILIPSNFTFK